MYHRKSGQLEDLNREKVGLESDLKQKITIANNQIEILTRENGEVKRKKIYVPPEGSVVIKKKDIEARDKALAELYAALKDTSLDRDAIKRRIEELLKNKTEEGDEEIVVKDKGFTFRPGYGLDFANSGIKPRLDFKFAYWQRWSTIFGGSPNGVGPGISRHVDDIIWSKLTNVEIFAGYNFITFDGRQGKYGVIGIRSNF
jgi:hypothetical protein